MNHRERGSENVKQDMMDNQHSSEFEQRLRQDMQQAPVPAGLADRIRARVAQAAAEKSPTDMGTLDASDQQVVSRADDGQSQQTSKSRRNWLVASTCAATLVLGGFSYWLFSGAITETQLIDFCMQRIQSASSESTPWEKATFAPSHPHVLRVVGNRGVYWAGYQETAGSPCGDTCRIWRMRVPRGQDLFVFELLEAAPIESLSEHFQRLPSRGSWSFAALQSENRIVLIATNGDIRDFLGRSAAVA